ncbi:MAG TPA: circadian clock KaiB family protein [Fimbriimonadaceae bacterium]|nr:circadian clock KaiB family protein [Fimbriimonadaceae bacterium]
MNAEELASFEEAIRRASESRYVLRLYVSGSSHRSANAISQVKSICDTYLADRYDLKIIDVFQQPELAQQMQLLAAPTLIKESPEPVRRVVGDMSDQDLLLYSLNLAKRSA